MGTDATEAHVKMSSFLIHVRFTGKKVEAENMRDSKKV